MVVVARKPERLVRGQEAAVWESAGPWGLSPGSALRTRTEPGAGLEAVGSVEPREVEMHRWEAAGPGACTSDITTQRCVPGRQVKEERQGNHPRREERNSPGKAEKPQENNHLEGTETG